MQIFLSHSSKQKPLVREIKRQLPPYLGLWIDEEKLLLGDSVSSSLEKTINTETDYVLLFLDHYAAQSSWVAKEIEWALKTEKRLNRTLLLPIVIDDDAITALSVLGLNSRKHLRIENFMESSVKTLAASIASEVFALVCRDMELLRQPKSKTPSAIIEAAERYLRSQAALIRKIVFPHRQSNPLALNTLCDVINSQDTESIDVSDLEQLLDSIAQRNLMPGLVYDGHSIFLSEEHARWKAEMHREKKQKIGRAASAMICNGMKIILDAGSTIEEVVRPLCKRIETRALTKLTIVTTSINIADMISDCCVSMGFDDEFSAVRLFIPGGRVRPNTQAIVASDGESRAGLESLASYLGGFDLGIVGVNGIDAGGGFTTHANSEASNKINLLRLAGACVAVGDSSKVGIVLECKIGSFDDDIKLIVDDHPDTRALAQSLGGRGNKIEFA